jgi:hypothetical protein
MQIDLQTYLDAICKKANDAAANAAGHMRLGGLIAALAEMPPDALITYDVGGAPSKPHSYRGYYVDLALGHSDAPATVKQTLNACKAAMGQCFEGYKGGDFWMTGNTLVWAASYGICGRRITGIQNEGEKVILATAPDKD